MTSNSSINPFVFVAKPPIPIISITVDNIAERQSEQQQKELRQHIINEYNQETRLGIVHLPSSLRNPYPKHHSQLDEYVENAKIKYTLEGDGGGGVPPQQYTLYDYLNDGSIIFSLMRFVQEVQDVTKTKEQFDFFRFYKTIHINKNKRLQDPLLNEEDSILLLDCFGRISFLIGYAWKLLVLAQKKKTKKSKPVLFSLYHLIQNRESLTYFLRLIDVLDHRVQSEYGIKYSESSTILKREQMIKFIYDFFLSYTSIPIADESVRERDNPNRVVPDLPPLEPAQPQPPRQQHGGQQAPPTRIDVNQTYQVLLAYLCAHKLNKYYLTIPEVETGLLNSPIEIQLMLVDYTSLIYNSDRLIRNKTSVNTEMRDNMSQRWVWHQQNHIPLFFTKKYNARIEELDEDEEKKEQQQPPWVKPEPYNGIVKQEEVSEDGFILINQNNRTTKHIKYPSRYEILYEKQQQRSRFKRWIVQSCNLL